MIQKFSSLVWLGVCSTILSTAALSSDEADFAQERMNAGSRAESLEVRLAHEELLAQMNHEKMASKNSRILQQAMAKSVHYTTHPGAYHNPLGISDFGDIEIEDGSVWQVNPSDSYVVFSWVPTDLLVITPNHGLFSSYQFKITNQNTGQAVLANLNLGPLYNGAYTRWITAIDYYYNVVYLDDGSVWNMLSWDSGKVSRWVPNDTVIIGVNDGFFSSTNPNILINVNTIEFASGVTGF